jgi:SPP1 family predicted phage head-tail adaptor
MKLVGHPERGEAGIDVYASIGAMRERVTLQSVARAKGTGGYATDTATSEETVPAEVVIEGGTEPFEAGGQRGQTRYRVRMRHRSDVRASWLLRWNDLTLQVLEAPVSDQRRRFLWLRCGAVEST